MILAMSMGIMGIDKKKFKSSLHVVLITEYKNYIFGHIWNAHFFQQIGIDWILVMLP